MFPVVKQEALVYIVSDHFPIMVDTCTPRWGPSPFKFENAWMDHPKFKEAFKTWWRQEEEEGWEGKKFMRKLKNMKTFLREWNKEVFSNLAFKKNCLILKVKELDGLEGQNQWSSQLGKERKQIKIEFEDISLNEEQMVAQKAKIRWLKEG